MSLDWSEISEERNKGVSVNPSNRELALLCRRILREMRTPMHYQHVARIAAEELYPGEREPEGFDIQVLRAINSYPFMFARVRNGVYKASS